MVIYIANLKISEKSHYI